MSFDENKLIKSWVDLQSSNAAAFENDENFWAFEKLDDLCFDEPLKCLDILLKICSISDDDKILANVAAGPLEDLLAQNGNIVIADLEKIAKTNPKIKKVLASVWRSSIDEDIWDRLKKITGNLSGY